MGPWTESTRRASSEASKCHPPKRVFLSRNILWEADKVLLNIWEVVFESNGLPAAVNDYRSYLRVCRDYLQKAKTQGVYVKGDRSDQQ